MKNVFTKYLILFFTIITMTGCIRYNNEMTINSDKSMSYSVIIAIDSSMYDEDDSMDFSQIDKREYENKGYYVTEYTDGTYKGVKLNLDVGNIDDYISEEDVTININDISNTSKIFTVKKGLIKNTYYTNISFDTSSYNKSNSDEAMISNDELDKLGDSIESYLDLKFVVNLPYKALNHNATSNEKQQKLIWDLSKHQENINFEFTLYNIKPIYLAMGAGIFLIIILITCLIKFSAKLANEESINDTNTNSYTNNNNNYPPKQDEIRNDFVPLNANQLYNDMINDSSSNNNINNSLNNNFINSNENNVNDFSIPEPILTHNLNNYNNSINNSFVDTNDNNNSSNNLNTNTVNSDDFSIPDPILTNSFDTQNNYAKSENSQDIINTNNLDNTIVIQEPITNLDNTIVIQEPITNLDNTIVIQEPITNLDNTIVIQEPIKNNDSKEDII